MARTRARGRWPLEAKLKVLKLWDGFNRTSSSAVTRKIFQEVANEFGLDLLPSYLSDPSQNLRSFEVTRARLFDKRDPEALYLMRKHKCKPSGWNRNHEKVAREYEKLPRATGISRSRSLGNRAVARDQASSTRRKQRQHKRRQVAPASSHESSADPDGAMAEDSSTARTPSRSNRLRPRTEAQSRMRSSAGNTERVALLSRANGFLLLRQAKKTASGITGKYPRAIAHKEIALAAARAHVNTQDLQVAKKHALSIDDADCQDAALSEIAVAEATLGDWEAAKETARRCVSASVVARALGQIAALEVVSGRARDAIATCEMAGDREALHRALRQSVLSRPLDTGRANLIIVLIDDEVSRKALEAEFGEANFRATFGGGDPQIDELEDRLRLEFEEESRKVIRAALAQRYDEAEESARKVSPPILSVATLSTVAKIEVAAGIDATNLFEEANARCENLGESRDEGLWRISLLQALAGRDLLAFSQSRLDGLSSEQRLALATASGDDASVLTAAGASFSKEEQVQLLDEVPELERPGTAGLLRIGRRLRQIDETDDVDYGFQETCRRPVQTYTSLSSPVSTGGSIKRLCELPDLGLMFLRTKKSVWVHFTDDGDDEWQRMPGTWWPTNVSFISQVGRSCGKITPESGSKKKVEVTYEDLEWLESQEAAHFARKKSAVAHDSTIFVNVHARQFVPAKAEPYELTFSARGQRRFRSAPSQRDCLESTGNERSRAKIPATQKRAMLSFVNGLVLLKDAKSLLCRIQAPSRRVLALAEMGSAETAIGWQTNLFQLAKEEVVRIQLPSIFHPEDKEVEDYDRDVARSNVACTEAVAGLVEEAKSTVAGIKTEDIRDGTLAKIAAIQASKGDLRRALATIDLIGNPDRVKDLLKTLALEEELAGGTGKARRILALVDDPEFHSTVEGKVVNAEDQSTFITDPVDRLVQESTRFLDDKISLSAQAAVCVLYALDRLFSIAPVKALQLPTVFDRVVTLSLIARLQAIAGVYPFETFRWAILATEAMGDELEGAKAFASETARTRTPLGRNPKKFLLSRIDEARQDLCYFIILAIETRTGAELCQRGLRALSELSFEEKVALIDGSTSDPLTLRTLGAYLPLDVQNEALRGFSKKRRSKARPFLEEGQRFVSVARSGEQPPDELFSFTSYGTSIPLIKYGRVPEQEEKPKVKKPRKQVQKVSKWKGKGSGGRDITIYGKRPNGEILSRQKRINTYNFPFTLNTTTGCLFNCRYCYLQTPRFTKHAKFGEEMIVKERIIPKLRRELEKYRDLPLHLRRVQIGPATEVYHPQAVKAFGGDSSSGLVRNVIRAFLDEQDAGYPWAVHLVTKSPLIEKDIDLLRRLVCFQAEITITTLSEEGKRQWEGNSPSVKRRFDIIKRLSDEGLFVRVMAMPLFLKPQDVRRIEERMKGRHAADIADEIERKRWENGEAIWQKAKACGAMAFKAKGLNYFDPDQLNDRGKPARNVKGRNEDPNKEMLIHSGEIVEKKKGKRETVKVWTWWYGKGQKKLKDGSTKDVKSQRKEGRKRVPLMDFGYQLMDPAKYLNWGDCRWSGNERSWQEIRIELPQEVQEVQDSNVIEVPSFFMIGWCPYCGHNDDPKDTTPRWRRLEVTGALKEDSGGKFYDSTCTACEESFFYYVDDLSSEERFPPERFLLSQELYDFMDTHSEFLASLRLSEPRFYFVPQKAVATQPFAESNSDDEVIGLFYVDQVQLQQGRKPLFVMDYIVNVGNRGDQFIAYTGDEEREQHVRPLSEFLTKYGSFERYYPGGSDRPLFPTYDDVDDLPAEVQDAARRALEAVSPALQSH